MTATLVLCATLAAAPVPKERAEAEKVVGTWKLVRSSNSPDGLTVDLTLELQQGGKLVIRQSSGGGPVAVYEGEYKVVKNELPYTVRYGNGEPDKKETLTIKKLTETELHVVDPDGIQEDFVRVKPAKKDEK
ncbi:MAG: hypothetical protein C0501_27460 [Isosphaera sp.]|nr:hypothetical protein [Isosphaera sp.]